MLGKYVNHRLVYSPRTTVSILKEREEKLFKDLKMGFESKTIETMKNHFKEHLGVLNKPTFISIIKNHFSKWHPDLFNREEIIIKLLSKLFDQIDLNSNGKIKWDEFMNFIVDSSYKNKFEQTCNSLQTYTLLKNNPSIDNQNKKYLMACNTHLISYCFYIQKLKLIGVVHDDKQKVIFYNAETNIKQGNEIDLVQTQNEIDKFEINELEHKANALIQKNSQKIKLLISKQKENSLKTISHRTSFSDFSLQNKKERIPTPIKIKKEIQKIKETEFVSATNKEKTKKLRKINTLSTCFINEYNLLFISTSNNKISAYHYNEYYCEFTNINSTSYQTNDYIFNEEKMNIPIFSTINPQCTICFDECSNILYSGQEDGKILIWEMLSPKPVDFLDYNIIKNNNSDFNNNHKSKINENKDFENNNNNKKKQLKITHSKRETVSCLLLLNKLRLICSAYYTGVIVLWDILTRKPKKVFNDQKTGIYQVLFDPVKNFLYTCGFEHDIYVYDPYNDDNSINQLKGHAASVKSLALNIENNELISIDNNGNMKIWDTNNFYNFQTINIYSSVLDQNRLNKKQAQEQLILFDKKKIMSNMHVLSLSDLKHIIVYGDKFLIFEKGKTKNPDLCDDNLILGCIYNNYSNELITFSNKRVKIWSIFTGKAKKMFEDPMSGNEITSFVCDKHRKRFYLGDNCGNIKNYNLFTWSFLKKFQSHKCEITNILHSAKFNLIISCSSDLIIKFQSDDEILSTELIREININNLFLERELIERNHLKDLKFNENDGILTLGLSNTWVSFYDVEHNKYLNSLNNPEKQLLKDTSITCIEDIIDLNTIFVAFENGKKCLKLKPNNKFCSVINYENFGNFQKIPNLNNENEQNEISLVLTSFYEKETNKLFIGDHIGLITCYDLKPLKIFMKMNFDNDENIKNYAFNNIQINIILNIKAHQESIKYICIPEDLKPKIILSTCTDRTVKLFNSENGEYIDSLKQISIKYNPIPIGIEYIKNNPFLNEVDEIEKDTLINYYNMDSFKNFNSKKNSEFDGLVKNNNNKSLSPKIATFYRNSKLKVKFPSSDMDNQITDIVKLTNNIVDYNAKTKLRNISMNSKIPSHRSTSWNYDMDLNYILSRNKENINDLITISKKNEDIIKKTELAYKKNSIYSNSYKPLFLKNLSDKDKEELSTLISNKIQNIKFVISRSQIAQIEQDNVKKLESNIKKNVYSSNSRKRSKNYFSMYSEKNKNKKFFSPDKEKSNLKMKLKTNFNSTNYFTKRNINKFKENTLNKNLRTINYKDEGFKNISEKKLELVESNNNNLYKYCNDQRIKKCMNQFKEELYELSKPIKNLMNSKSMKGKILPKLAKNFLNTKY